MRGVEKPIRMWRCSKPEQGHGLFVWFDPDEEALVLRELTEEEKSVNLDSVFSVSALVEGEGLCSADGCDGSHGSETLPLFPVDSGGSDG